MQTHLGALYIWIFYYELSNTLETELHSARGHPNNKARCSEVDFREVMILSFYHPLSMFALLCVLLNTVHVYAL